MRKFCVLLLCFGFLAALDVSGPQEVFTLDRNQSARMSVVLNNRSDKSAAVRVDYFFAEGPDNESQYNPRQMLDSINRQSEVAIAPHSHQSYSWEIRTSNQTEYGNYLFWVVFSVDNFTQSTEEGDFVVQDVSYFPVRIRCQNRKE